jgi:hypothetical protein
VFLGVLGLIHLNYWNDSDEVLECMDMIVYRGCAKMGHRLI